MERPVKEEHYVFETEARRDAVRASLTEPSKVQPSKARKHDFEPSKRLAQISTLKPTPKTEYSVLRVGLRALIYASTLKPSKNRTPAGRPRAAAGSDGAATGGRTRAMAESGGGRGCSGGGGTGRAELDRRRDKLERGGGGAGRGELERGGGGASSVGGGTRRIGKRRGGSGGGGVARAPAESGRGRMAVLLVDGARKEAAGV
jgi:hypothetical protein